MIDRIPCALFFMAFLFATGLCYGAQLDAPAASDAPPLPELRLSLKVTMDAAMGNSVKLFKERVEQAKAAAFTQLGALLPNLSSNVRQSRQTFFLGTVGLAPLVTSPFSIFDARVSATQSLFSLSLIDRWRASRKH